MIFKHLAAKFFWILFVMLALGCFEITLASAASIQYLSEEASAPSADIEVFVREGCPHCAKAEAFLKNLQFEQPALRIVIRDVLKSPADLERLKRIAEDQGLAMVSVPTFIVRGQLIVGFSDEETTGKVIRGSLAPAESKTQAASNISDGCIAGESLFCEEGMLKPAVKPETFSVDFLGHSLSLDQIGLPLFTLAMGLLDGFNPCSMWVLILMISLLAPINRRSRMLAIAGTFVIVEGLVYFIFMAAWLNLFILIGLSCTSEVIIAMLAILAGAINLKDFWAFGWGISLSIPATAKPGIYARLRNILQAENLAAAILGTVVLAILVQIVEFMCTSGFPALFTRILTLKQLDSMSYYGYLLLYDLAYMFDDVVILAIGVITLSQRRLQEKEGRWLKLISGFVMVGLGVYLLLG